jgi:hypothetical protein
MAARRTVARPPSAIERDMRDQEVVRANREIAAYFRGQRTEREARAALKIIKAFVRDRERQDPQTRPPLPGRRSAKPVKTSGAPKPKTRRAARTPIVVSAPAPPTSIDEPASE